MLYDLKIVTSGKCNFKCSYCYERDVRDRIPDYMSEETTSSIINLIINDITNIKSISFLGGETYFSIDDILRIITPVKDYLYQNDIGVYLFTNGSIFNEEIEDFYKKISQVKSPIVYITDHKLSLNQLSDNVLFQHIKFLKCNNIEYRLKLVINKYKFLNFDQVVDYYNTNINESIEMVLGYYDKFNEVTNVVMNKFVNYIDNNMYRMSNKLLKEIMNLFRCRSMIDENVEITKCGAGVTELAITSDGRVHGCENIITANDSDVVHVKNVASLESLQSNHSDFKMFKRQYLNTDKKCETCPFTSTCTQCRYNFTTNENIYSDKPQEICNFTKLIYVYGVNINLMIVKRLISRNISNIDEYNKHIMSLQRCII